MPRSKYDSSTQGRKKKLFGFIILGILTGALIGLIIGFPWTIGILAAVGGLIGYGIYRVTIGKEQKKFVDVSGSGSSEESGEAGKRFVHPGLQPGYNQQETYACLPPMTLVAASPIYRGPN